VASEGGILGALFLGALQGLTEFLPVSSSGHLVLFQQFVDVGEEEVFFDLVLHLGTLFPVLWFYRRDLRGIVGDVMGGQGPVLQRPGARLAALVVLASVPTAIIGLGFEDLFESLFSRPEALVVSFAVTAVLLWSTRWAPAATRTLQGFPLWLALVLGLAQGLAITPGISRSGTTIAVALLFGVDRELAARFSFLMSVPAISGAILLKSRDVSWSAVDPIQLAAGGFTALFVGYFALILLVRLVKAGRLSNFAVYCGFMSLVAAAIAFRG
jgi:undecaprenyl-diphosphatase